ncbi:unnamed protein product [Allacma fusca]|uniref:UBA domain-containing protein n=1 Tax=Allacma fusca TaxID=39272 RepID=A0A8J2KFD7_9HEXA|nr:unnamed protein product [Allacma fusca]
MAAMMLNQHSTTGFYKAPVCKGLIGTMFLTCTAIHVPMMTHLRQYLSCQIPQILSSAQIWRLLFNRLTFLHTKDILCSVLVIYCFRIFERRMGSKRFSSYLLGTCTIATILEICTVLVLARFNIDYHSGGYLPSGLYGFLFPLFVNYYLDIPRITMSNFLGMSVTGKTITYLLGLQIASTSPATVVSALCGIIAGLIYRANLFKVQRVLRVPDVVARCCDKALGWAFNSNEPKQQHMGATLDIQRQEQAELWEQQYLYSRAQDFRQVRGQGYTDRLIDDLPADNGLMSYIFRNRRRQGDGSMDVEPSNENIQILVDMGFDRSQAVEALRTASNDLETATSILLRQ